MSFRSPTLPPEVPGRLLLDAMPGRLEPWPQFLRRAREADLRLVVCLNPLDEVAALSPDYRDAIADGSLPFRWLHLPMRNFGVAEYAQPFRDGVDQIATALRQGDAVLLHCAAGMGRTGSTAACVLKRLGCTRDEALRAVRAAGSSPESAQQSGLIDSF